jgi:tetratricopeptide (TPR) repeat protein
MASPFASSPSSTPVDAAAIKALLQTGDLLQLQQAVAHFDETFQQYDDTSVEHQQFCKLLIVLYNRILNLQTSRDDKVATLQRIARLWSDVGEFDKSIAQLRKALELATEGIPSQRAPILQLIGDAYMESSDYRAAVDSHQQAIDRMSSSSPSSGLALAYARLATVHEASGDFTTASNTLRTALQIIAANANGEGGDDAERGDKDTAASVYGQLGTLQYKIGEYSQAVENLGKALELHDGSSPKAKDLEYLLQMAASLAG